MATRRTHSYTKRVDRLNALKKAKQFRLLTEEETKELAKLMQELGN